MPFVKFGGLKFLEAAHVKDFVAAIRLLDNTLDEVAWYRLLRLHDGIGPARARTLLQQLDRGEVDGPAAHAEAVAAAPAISRVALAATLDALATARGQRRIGDRATACLDLLRPLLTARYPDSVVRIADLERLVAAAASAPDLGAFVAELTLDPPASTGDLAGPPHLDDDYLVLSTVHSAKGLEWPIVHVMHLVDGAFPADMALDHRAGSGRGATTVLRGGDQGRRRAVALRAAADAAPPACPRRQAQLRADQPVPGRRRPWPPSMSRI